ncbi:thiopeptide-type bacteriocin biosynthesis protein [Actinomadura sp. SCN-SB]|uniref:thiopeptide-type bacteriocin biosynthesis protein n=1 Tax=Actinomadura sp. SCN-SB TaxID=3373092 RepID=UPI00375315FD
MAGEPPQDIAVRLRTTVTAVEEAIELFKSAGQDALIQAQASDQTWYEIRVQFHDWQAAEQTATTLAPRINDLQERETITGWWFIRKHPCWRIRLHINPATDREQAESDITALLQDLTEEGALATWWPAIYEPESAAFGGPTGIDAAHKLFCDDTRYFIHYIQQPLPIGRREISMLLCTILLHAAGLDTFEQGDVWHRVTQLRPSTNAPTSRINDLAATLAPLINTAPHIEGPLFNIEGPLNSAQPWAAAFNQSGRVLGQAAGAGNLDRGLRHILSHQVIFHWNRLGLSTTTQANLSRAARTAALP